MEKIINERAIKGLPVFKNATLYGEACEDWTFDNLQCRQCGVKNWTKMPRNHPGFDLSCNNCDTKYQIKGAKRGHIKTRKNKCDILGATYNAVFQCSIKYNIDYYLFDYNIKTNDIKNIYFVNHKKICCKKNLKTRMVHKTANKKAGRPPTAYCSYSLDSGLCEKVYPYITVKTV